MLLNVLDTTSRKWVDQVAYEHRLRYPPMNTSEKHRRRLCPFVTGTAHWERWWMVYLGNVLVGTP